MSKIYKKYEELCLIPSDINEHLPTLFKYASECEHVTEMGVRWIVSTWALLAANPNKMISYDIKNPNNWGANIFEVLELSREENLNYTFIEQDVLTADIEETDLLFIDTLHNYAQLKEELRLHANKVRKYLIFHDIVSYGYSGESDDKGILPAINEFLSDNTNWYVREQFINNNGLLVLARK